MYHTSLVLPTEAAASLEHSAKRQSSQINSCSKERKKNVATKIAQNLFYRSQGDYIIPAANKNIL